MFKKLLLMVWGLLLTLHYNEIGAIAIKDITRSTDKWSDNAGRAATEMADNAVAAADKWARETGASADTFHMAITAANIKERFRRGVAKAGAAKFARKVGAVAASRFSEGVGVAKDDYKAGAEPYFSTIAGLTLSGRKPRGDPANYRRVEEIGKALNAKRLAMLGAGGG